MATAVYIVTFTEQYNLLTVLHIRSANMFLYYIIMIADYMCCSARVKQSIQMIVNGAVNCNTHNNLNGHIGRRNALVNIILKYV